VCDKSGKAVESARFVKKGDNVSIVLSDGTLLSEIKDISINKHGGAKDA
jgi:exodeoxyribonuclease VII large subunit